MKFKILPLVFTFLLINLCGNDLMAQLKIGNNPATIEATSNLEVEASDGRKFKIDKTTGTVTIKDGSQENEKVLVSDAEGNARWRLLTPSNLSAFPFLLAAGAATGPLTNGERVYLSFPSLMWAQGGFHIPLSGVYNVLYEGKYNVETSLTIENSEGCTGTSLMGIEVNPVYSGVLSEYAVLDERLAPVYQDRYILKATVLTNLMPNSNLSFSILPNIKSPQDGCVVKVLGGEFKISYLP
ncbi:hypothetical protein [Dyadobacter sp. CY347]|uniref:hypothetical protein n=1 Tax=Dyadobacter sp. CY347 TaxID=2909336 RepID=UPI001F245E1B|nr:hypothetical protein [Dyadobacter sp. CY347]MCF2490726.1 hypothetical protein [Dyadobacter sp. CY347]